MGGISPASNEATKKTLCLCKIQFGVDKEICRGQSQNNQTEWIVTYAAKQLLNDKAVSQAIMKIKQSILFGLFGLILIVAGTLFYKINLNWWNILNLLILAGAIVAVVWLLILLSRFVKACERMASVLEDAARKFREGNKQ